MSRSRNSHLRRYVGEKLYYEANARRKDAELDEAWSEEVRLLENDVEQRRREWAEARMLEYAARGPEFDRFTIIWAARAR